MEVVSQQLTALNGEVATTNTERKQFYEELDGE